MVASALEAPRVLLPYLPELLADLEELGSDSDLIVQVALRHPELTAELLAFADDQERANAHIRENLIGAVWAIKRV